MRIVLALASLLVAQLLTLPAVLAASDCDLPTRDWEMSDVSGNPITAGKTQVQTNIMVVEVARREIAEFGIRWTGILVSPFDRRTLDLREVDSGRSQLIDALPASSIAVGRLAMGSCRSDFLKALERTTTAIVSPGPRFAISNEMSTLASAGLFAMCFAREPLQHSAIDDSISTIRLSSRLLADNAVQLELDSLIKFHFDGAAVAIHGNVSIESEGVLVLAARAKPPQSIQEWRKGGATVVLLFIQANVL